MKSLKQMQIYTASHPFKFEDIYNTHMINLSLTHNVHLLLSFCITAHCFKILPVSLFWTVFNSVVWETALSLITASNQRQESKFNTMGHYINKETHKILNQHFI